MKLITAIVRTTTLDTIVKSLEDAGIKEITISEIKGIGEQVQICRPYTIHNKIEIFIPDERVEEAVGMILNNASIGMAGDGILAVTPVEQMYKIRTREKIK